MTMDATDVVHPNGLHEDEHSLVTNPSNPLQFFEGSDGGIMRSNGTLAGVFPETAVRAGSRGRCLPVASSYSPRFPLSCRAEQGTRHTPVCQCVHQPVRPNLGSGWDAGQRHVAIHKYAWPVSVNLFWRRWAVGFDAVNPKFRFHTTYNASPDVNFSNGAAFDWNWIGDPIYNTGEEFYVPIISDPAVSGTMFVGTATVYRTKTHGMGSLSLSEFRKHCNELTGDFAVTCGDWVTIGATSLTSTNRGSWAEGSVAAVQRTPSDNSTLWAATSTGRVFISHNADAEPNTAVVFRRIDTKSPAAPNRFVTGIAVDPTNSDHAWISYDGYDASTPSTPGHVFEVTYDPVGRTATFTDRSYDLRDLPINDVVLDSVRGDLYASSDFGVYRLPSGSTVWRLAAKGMPNVEVPGLTIVPNARLLYAASFGMGVWVLKLP